MLWTRVTGASLRSLVRVAAKEEENCLCGALQYCNRRLRNESSDTKPSCRSPNAASKASI